MKNILDIANELTSADRPDVYGSALEDYECTAAIWEAMLRKANPGKMPEGTFITPELAVAMMAGMKLSRFAYVAVREVLGAGLTDKSLDSLVDGCGYLRMPQIMQAQRDARDSKCQECGALRGAHMGTCSRVQVGSMIVAKRGCPECGGRQGTHMKSCSHWVCIWPNVENCSDPDCKTHGPRVVKKGGPPLFGEPTGHG